MNITVLRIAYEVSIPSNRGIPSDFMFAGRERCARKSLNPLESGHSFGPDHLVYSRARLLHGLNPLESGHSFGLKHAKGKKRYFFTVSIPSNRGIPSDDTYLKQFLQINGQSQSPRIGAFLRTFVPVRIFLSLSLSLNPLESGHSFGQTLQI